MAGEHPVLVRAIVLLEVRDELGGEESLEVARATPADPVTRPVGLLKSLTRTVLSTPTTIISGISPCRARYPTEPATWRKWVWPSSRKRTG